MIVAVGGERRETHQTIKLFRQFAQLLIEADSAWQSFRSIKWRKMQQHNFPNRWKTLYICVFGGRNIPLDSIMQMWSLTVWGLTVVSSYTALHQIIIFSFPGHRTRRNISRTSSRNKLYLTMSSPHLAPRTSTLSKPAQICSDFAQWIKQTFSFCCFVFNFLSIFLSVEFN